MSAWIPQWRLQIQLIVSIAGFLLLYVGIEGLLIGFLLMSGLLFISSSELFGAHRLHLVMLSLTLDRQMLSEFLSVGRLTVLILGFGLALGIGRFVQLSNLEQVYINGAGASASISIVGVTASGVIGLKRKENCFFFVSYDGVIFSVAEGTTPCGGLFVPLR